MNTFIQYEKITIKNSITFAGVHEGVREIAPRGPLFPTQGGIRGGVAQVSQVYKCDQVKPNSNRVERKCNSVERKRNRVERRSNRVESKSKTVIEF